MRKIIRTPLCLKKVHLRKFILIILILLTGCDNSSSYIQITLSEGFQKDLVAAATERTKLIVIYNGKYRKIPYPNGDVPNNIGVCTDLIIRAYRKIGIDLQQLVHEDMIKFFNLYPSRRIWGLKRADSNIDHRRVPNLQTFFKRNNASLEISDNPNDYHPGDIVAWDWPGRSPWHIGIVSDRKSERTGVPLMIHNMGRGPQIADALFKEKAKDI